MKSQNLKHKLLSSESTIRKLIKNNLKLNNFKSNCFSRKNLKQKTSKFQYYVVYKLRNLLGCLLPYINPNLYPKCINSGIQATVKPNKPLSVVIVHKHGLHNDVTASCNSLVKELSTEFLWCG